MSDKLVSCPLCGSSNAEDYPYCFHCADCGYLQCCDDDGYYKRVPASRAASEKE
jgi:hypothetical protein